MPNTKLDKVSEFKKLLDMAEGLQIDTMEELSSFKIFQPGMGLGVQSFETSQYIKPFASTRMHETSTTMLNVLKNPVPVPRCSSANLFPGPISENFKNPLLGMDKIFAPPPELAAPLDLSIFCEVEAPADLFISNVPREITQALGDWLQLYINEPYQPQRFTDHHIGRLVGTMFRDPKVHNMRTPKDVVQVIQNAYAEVFITTPFNTVKSWILPVPNVTKPVLPVLSHEKYEKLGAAAGAIFEKDIQRYKEDLELYKLGQELLVVRGKALLDLIGQFRSPSPQPVVNWLAGAGLGVYDYAGKIEEVINKMPNSFGSKGILSRNPKILMNGVPTALEGPFNIHEVVLVMLDEEQTVLETIMKNIATTLPEKFRVVETVKQVKEAKKRLNKLIEAAEKNKNLIGKLPGKRELLRSRSLTVVDYTIDNVDIAVPTAPTGNSDIIVKPPSVERMTNNLDIVKDRLKGVAKDAKNDLRDELINPEGGIKHWKTKPYKQTGLLPTTKRKTLADWFGIPPGGAVEIAGFEVEEFQKEPQLLNILFKFQKRMIGFAIIGGFLYIAFKKRRWLKKFLKRIYRYYCKVNKVLKHPILTNRFTRTFFTLARYSRPGPV